MNEGCWHNKTSGHFLLWKGEFYFDVVGNFESKKITPICNALAKSIISYLGVSYFPFIFLVNVLLCYLQAKMHAVTSLERADGITWYKQKRRRNRWASKQVSWRYISLKINKKCIFFSIQTNHNKPMHILFQNYFDNLS